MTTSSPWHRPPLPPITGTPLDFVPIDAPILKKRPTVFSAPTLRRALVAALVFGAIGLAVAYPVIAMGATALGIMTAAVWGGGKLADRMAAHDNH
jgi:hypothetical protein